MASATTPFEAMPFNSNGHFRLLFYEGVIQLLSYLHGLSKMGEPGSSYLKKYAFLENYENEVLQFLPPQTLWKDAAVWWRNELARWEDGCSARLPLRSLCEALGLTADERLLLILIGAVEQDIRFGSLYAALQEPLATRWPCIGLLSSLTSHGRTPGDGFRTVQKLISGGLVVAENKDSPRADWIVHIHPALWDAMRGTIPAELGPDCIFYSKRNFPPLKKLVLDPHFRDRLCRLPELISRRQIGAIVLRGMAESGRRTVMGSLARAMRRNVIYCDRRRRTQSEDFWHLIGPLCALINALPVVETDPAPGETVELPRLAGYAGPIGVIMRREGGVALDRSITLTLPPPSASQRREIWKRTLSDHDDSDLESISDRFLMPLGNVHRTGAIATAYAELEGRRTVSADDVRAACRSLKRESLDTLAQRLEVAGDWNNLIVNDATAADLNDLELRCRHRERLLRHLGQGFSASVNCGVRALLVGPSGTGKTLAAKILGSVLKMDVYRLDLASTVNKYIGETEKNLSQLLAQAEEMDVLLLIDEGDALMTNRTDVKSANDRYANLETNYLLQRLETYQGIIVVTTNTGSRIDQAFQRRFDVVIEFHPPDRHERQRIWEQHLPATHQVSGEFLRELSQHCAMTGGQIRNASLHASLLAVEERRGGLVTDRDLRIGTEREYRKAGASFPLRRSAAAEGHSTPLAQFLGEIY